MAFISIVLLPELRCWTEGISLLACINRGETGLSLSKRSIMGTRQAPARCALPRGFQGQKQSTAERSNRINSYRRKFVLRPLYPKTFVTAGRCTHARGSNLPSDPQYQNLSDRHDMPPSSLAHSALLISTTSKPAFVNISAVRGKPAGQTTYWLNRMLLAAASSPSAVCRTR